MRLPVHSPSHCVRIIAVVMEMITLPACSSTISTGRIAFYSSEAGKYGSGRSNIYVINADGSGLAQLTNGGSNVYPVWSPDGKWIAFQRFGEIYKMNANGSSQTPLTKISRVSSLPTWSPDSEEIAFETYEDYGNIYVINADGSGLKLITQGIDAREPKWSPDGQRIVFLYLREHHANFKIAIVNTQTGGWKVLTKDYPGDDLSPVWSPDGQKLAFLSGLDGQIHLIDIKEAIQPTYSNNTTAVTSKDVFSIWFSLAWSSDSTKIAFVSNRDGNAEIYVVNLEAGDETRLTSNSTDDLSPAWSPDGKQITFVSERDGNQEIYVMNVDGSDQRRLTNTPEDEWNPVWQPR